MKRRGKYVLTMISSLLIASIGTGAEIEDSVISEVMKVGEFYQEKKCYGIAERLYRKLLEKYPTTSFAPQIKLKIANCLVGKEAFEEALSVYRDIEKSYPNSEYSCQALLGEISILTALRRNDQLLERLDTFITSYPTNEEVPKVLYMKANILQEKWEEDFDKKARDEAVKTYKMLILKFPQHPLAEKSFEKLETLWRDIERFGNREELWKNILYRLLLLASYYW